MLPNNVHSLRMTKLKGRAAAKGSCFLAMAGSLVLVSVSGCAPRAQSAPPAPSETVVSAMPSAARAAGGEYISWREHRVDDEELAGGVVLRGGDGLELADLDRDGLLDVVSVHEDSDHVRVAFGSAELDDFELVTLAAGEEAAAAEDVAVGDINRDGWPDLVVACELAHLLYLQNPRENVRAGRWPRAIPAVTRGRGSYIRAYLADFDRDGDLEVVSANKGDQLPHGAPVPSDFPLTAYSIFEPGADPLDPALWREHILGRAKVPINSQPLDLDGDGDQDVIAGSRFEGRLFWFENLHGPGQPGPHFAERRIDVTNRTVPASRGPRFLDGFTMAFADLNGDGRVDIITEESPVLVSWLEQPAALDQPWIIHPIGTLTPDNPTGLLLADLDTDGDLDLFTGGYSDNPRDHDQPGAGPEWVAGRLAWFENRFENRFASPGGDSPPWPRHDVLRLVRGMYDEFAAVDRDGDGDLDLFGTRGNSAQYDGLFWLEQVRSLEPQPVFAPARAQESRHLPLPSMARRKAT